MSRFYLVTPSGHCINQQAAARGVKRLQQAGHGVAHQQVIPYWQQRFAGTEQERLVDVNQLARLPGRDRIVLAVRDGYDASRLLPRIDWRRLIARQQRDPLLACGHSDFTAIQSGLLATGSVITFSGPILADSFGAETLDPFIEHHSWQALRRVEFTLERPGEGPNCRVEGTPWGGNLAMLTSLIGTPWLLAVRDGILVMEDINKHPFRVERMLLQLLHSGMLAAQKTVVFGDSTGDAPNGYDAEYDLSQVFDYLRQQLSLPLTDGPEFGHEQRTIILPLDARARLINQAATTTLTISGHPVLTE